MNYFDTLIDGNTLKIKYNNNTIKNSLYKELIIKLLDETFNKFSTVIYYLTKESDEQKIICLNIGFEYFTKNEYIITKDRYLLIKDKQIKKHNNSFKISKVKTINDIDMLNEKKEEHKKNACDTSWDGA